MSKRQTSILISTLLLWPFLALAIDSPQPYQVSYSANYNGMAVKALRQLSKTSAGYRIETKMKGLLGSMNEREDFHIDSQGRIQPDHYVMKKSFFGITSTEALVVDRGADRAVYTRGKKYRELAIEPDHLGPISYQLQLRSDLKNEKPTLSYQVMARGRVKTYQFELLKEESIDTGVGKIHTLKLRRVRNDKKKRETLFWVAPDLDYLIVKITQREQDGKHYELLLESASIAGQPISP